MSGWRIVPVSRLNPDLSGPTIGPLFNMGWDAAMKHVAAAPEPDWEELAEQIYAYYWNDYDTNGSASLVRALKITFGSKP